MTWTLQNLTSNSVAIDSYVLSPNGVQEVGELTPDMLTASVNKIINISPTPLSVANPITKITDNTTGSATANSGAAVAVTSYTDSNNNFALILLQLNNTIELVNGILAALKTSNNIVI